MVEMVTEDDGALDTTAPDLHGATGSPINNLRIAHFLASGENGRDMQEPHDFPVSGVEKLTPDGSPFWGAGGRSRPSLRVYSQHPSPALGESWFELATARKSILILDLAREGVDDKWNWPSSFQR